MLRSKLLFVVRIARALARAHTHTHTHTHTYECVCARACFCIDLKPEFFALVCVDSHEPTASEISVNIRKITVVSIKAQACVK